MATGASIRPSKLHRRQFQELTAECFDRQAAAIGGLSEKVQAQGEFIADLAADRDYLKSELQRYHDIAEAYKQADSTFLGRLGWLFRGR